MATTRELRGASRPPLLGQDPSGSGPCAPVSTQGWITRMPPERVRPASADLLGQSDEDALGASDVAEPIHVFVLHHFVDELRAMLAEPGQRIVEVVHGEHD